MTQVVLLLGGNLGDVRATFEGVRADLEREVGEVMRYSPIMRSEAWGFEAEPFLNQAVIISTKLEAEALLDAVQKIENRWGRNRQSETEMKILSGEKYTSRSIDIDIIFYGDSIIESPRLTVPHLLMAKREFVLEPIAEIAPHLVNAKNGKSVEQMLNELKG
ncbi:MAG: 2-amino-4-hydroxy-6-hydroxymethyldihydropteridine diphosphokinase [Rikenellaceae bacterium]